MSNLSNDFCRLFCEQTYTAMVGFDCQCRITAWNQAAAETFGIESKEMLGQGVAQILPEENRETLGEVCRRAVEANAAGEFRLRLRRKDGEAVELSVKVNPLYDEEGRLRWGVVWAEDITQLRKLERELAASARLSSLGTLAGGVAHHFNNILGGVSTFVDYALSTDDPRASRRALQMTAQAAERAGKITKSLLAFAQKDGGGEDLADLTEVVLTFASLVEKSLAEKHIELDLELNPAPVVPVRVDWMHTVLGNLLDNAEDAMPEGGRVDIEVGADEKSVWVKFSDEGVGIESEECERVFEPFYTTKGVMGEGEQNKPGLGLAVVHGLVREMGGVVELTSNAWQGASFKISFGRADGKEGLGEKKERNTELRR